MLSAKDVTCLAVCSIWHKAYLKVEWSCYRPWLRSWNYFQFAGRHFEISCEKYLKTATFEQIYRWVQIHSRHASIFHSRTFLWYSFHRAFPKKNLELHKLVLSFYFPPPFSPPNPSPPSTSPPAPPRPAPFLTLSLPPPLSPSLPPSLR